MKKVLLFALTLFSINLIHATTHTVQVANFQFTPAVVNASVGDTIKWTWVSGSHTTTSTSVPAGASTWSSAINTSSTTFTYKLTVAGTYSYWCIPHAPNMAGTLNVSAVLPVVLTDFRITATGNTANILWRTANEQNVAFYTIKKSSDGTNFTAIGQVNALNTAGANSYNFTDDALSPGDKYVYYYIDIMDKDGSYSSSTIQPFKNILVKTGFLRQVTPNPVNGTDHLMLQFYADKQSKMIAQLFSAGGALIKQTEMNAVTGINNGHFHTGTLAAGTYILQCTMDGKKETRQIIVQ